MLKLVGAYSSAFTRRVAISMQVIGIDYQHVPLQTFKDAETLRAINPLIKSPTLVFEDGQILQESSFILDYLDCITSRPIMPRDADGRLAAYRILSVGLLAADKVMALFIETRLRDQAQQIAKVIDRFEGQIRAALEVLEAEPLFANTAGEPPEHLDQPRITTAVVVDFVGRMMPHLISPEQYPTLYALSAQMERHAAFIATKP